MMTTLPLLAQLTKSISKRLPQHFARRLNSGATTATLKNGLTLAIFLVTAYMSASAQDNSLQATISNHLLALTSKNLNALQPTVADSVLLILPNGKTLKGKQSFTELHQQWFADSLWDLKPLEVNVKQSDSLGYALVHYRYVTYVRPSVVQSKSETLLLLIFERQPGGWKLIHDQNTKTLVNK